MPIDSLANAMSRIGHVSVTRLNDGYWQWTCHTYGNFSGISLGYSDLIKHLHQTADKMEQQYNLGWGGRPLANDQ